MQKNREKWVFRIIVVIFVITAVCIVAMHVREQNYLFIAFGPLSLLFLLIPSVAGKVFKKDFNFTMRLFILIFSFFAFSLGVGLRWYEKSAVYDKIMHLISGVLFSVIGFYIYAKTSQDKPYNIESKWLLQISYSFFFSMFVAVIWEIFEFMGFVLFAHDAQHHLTTGVFDTMQDIISCFLGSAVFSLAYLLYMKKGMSSPFIKLIQSFEDTALPKEGTLDEVENDSSIQK